ncbi:SMP-30/gluconolactonase/LRE family protein [Rathayibacter sp. VKM Ac-2835]|uniref:SMP-30/gluconolactonase/LRE family protein n=1 Tax=Rathayibacter sp. VKM Ac-2835 TaxID=2739043 RepID=UPI001566AA49|nr:SMP-30/gluconolactonase/LRE family protein [Rathayibacter sp. VKM Ac-2835]NRG41460.1 SMP-30/gluconolactonase/LRE family protein [Rathayibacter sp. VKM Ac-2835]
MGLEARVFRDTGAILVESPFWHRGRLHWADISTGTVHVSAWDGAVDGSDDRVVAVEAPLGSFQPVSGGGFVAALSDRVVLLDESFAVTRELAPIEHVHAGLRMNEGKCDPFGRFVAGSMNLTTGEPDAALYRIDADGALETLLGGFGVANGFEWSDDGRTFYFTDTAASTVYRAAYGPGDELGEPEPFLTGRAFDGLALDVDGGFWAGANGEGAVLHWSAAGELLEEIAIPAPNVTGVAFGGPDGATLFVGTARENLEEQQLRDAPLSGAVFAIGTSTRGRPANAFAQAG